MWKDWEMQILTALCNTTRLSQSRETEYGLAFYCGDMNVLPYLA